ncbi:MAG: bL27 family ribosomal protein [Candidatus Absconditabacterales bacterium]|nr:bL27 family ribosomal protein [Candidatus Absconditabacterales bacterium]
MAFKRAQGSTKNGRDSRAKYRGIKLFGSQFALSGNIIVRQVGSKYEAGRNTYMGKDFSIHASQSGIVHFTRKKKLGFDGRKYIKTYVHVIPVVA